MFGSGSLKSVSPVSSLDSGSQAPFTLDPIMFENHLKSSPLIMEVLDRLARCELTNTTIQRELGEVHRKVNFLVERALSSQNHGQPEFKDPFSNNGASTPSLLNPRGSIGNIAPHQIAPVDDIGTISQRLNSLTTSVGQLLAIQTQQFQQSTLLDPRSSIVSLNTPPLEIPPNQILAPPGPNNVSLLGHGIPGRPDLRTNPRQPNAPVRTWSTGALELPPIRPLEQNPQRSDSLAMGKRRSVTGLVRRDSSGVIDPQGDSPRDGPVISKWEHLPLSPELLRSLTKFGIGPPNKIQQRALPFLLRGSDIIAQAPPTQERIAAYVIPAIQVVMNYIRTPNRGPLAIMISTTVDQATQAQRMIRDLGGPIGVRSALGVGATNANSDLSQELRLLQQNMPHIICGTPQKLHALFTTQSGLIGSEVRLLVLDEVDQLIARNLHEFVFNIVKILPPPRSRPIGPNPSASSANLAAPTFTSPFEANNPTLTPLQVNNGRRFSSMTASPAPPDTSGTSTPQPIERQTALFSNTVPQDVLNLASAINLREPVRVLVRRDGGGANPDNSQTSRGLRQFYLYLAFTASGRSDQTTAGNGGGLGIIGSGRGATSAETTQAREWKLDALIDLFEDIEINQCIVHVGGMATLDAVVYKLATRGMEAVPLHGEMSAGTKLAALNKFRSPGPSLVSRPMAKVLVVYDVQVKSPEVSHIPLVINYDLPKAVEEYAQRVVPAIAPNYSRAGVVINFVTATGGDVEMLRSIECFYKIKCPEVPMSLRDII
ncbi:hypothetical protein EST38_g578 [Candolleomyces aberdarensis]|uniref:RNA helicase n=1 Tax=Candolleomyces aberdarensis TaxID=2316362 RepID=A0A4Q2E0M8_9AGAR|nr:hypothetical protein EST38_g578 [Candolleomyces aberdarensis]